MDNSQTSSPTDAFARMFADMFAGMAAGAPQAAANPMEMGKHAQKAFLDAMAKQCDEFLRSEQYLSMMKKTMDQALAFRQQLDRFLGQAHQSAAAVSPDGNSEILQAIADMGSRMSERLDEMESRLARLEGKSPTASRTGSTSRPTKTAKQPGGKKRR